MIYELGKNQYDKVRPLFSEMDYQIAIPSILNGNTRGRVYANDPLQPTACLIWNVMDSLFLVGAYQEDNEFLEALNELLVQTVMPEASERGVPVLVMDAAPFPTPEQADMIFHPVVPESLERLRFRFDHLDFDWHEHIEDCRCQVQRIDAALLEQTGLKNYDSMMGWIESFWPTPRDFLRAGIGYCVQTDSTIASWCLSVYVSEKTFEFGVATAPGCQGHGYATQAASATAEACLERGIAPYWQCNKDNIASIHVAERLGFQVNEEYQMLLVEF